MVTRGRENLIDKQLGKVRTMSLPRKAMDFIDKYMDDILEREGRTGDIKLMLRNAYIVGMLHGSSYEEYKNDNEK